MKRTMCIILVLNLCLGAVLCRTSAADSEGVPASPSNNRVFVDGKEVSPAAYKIGGSNYFKLRDLACMLSGTAKQFNCCFDKDTRSVVLTSGEAYTPVGGELAAPGDKVSAKVSHMPVIKDGLETALTGYLIRGNNYFKLRDVMELFGIQVWYDGSNATVRIQTASEAEEAGTAGQDAPQSWQDILASSGEVREIPFHFSVQYMGKGVSLAPANGCTVSLYFMDKSTGQPICQIGTCRTGADGCADVLLKLPWKYIQDSDGRDSLTPSWFGYKLQDSMEIEGRTYIGKFIVQEYSFLQLNDLYPLSGGEGRVNQIICDEAIRAELIENIGG